jgi:NAD(P)H-dependent FMN reductase
MHFHIISCSASAVSVSRTCAHHLKTELSSREHTVDFTDIRDLPPVWVDNRDISDYPSEYSTLFASVQKSDGVIFAWPVYNYTISSGAKALSEIVGKALTDKPTGFLIAGGSGKSYLASGDFMTSMIFEQRTRIFPHTVFATKSDIIEETVAPELAERITQFLDGFTNFTEKNRA